MLQADLQPHDSCAIRTAYVVTTNRIGGAENNLLRILRQSHMGSIDPTMVVLPKDGELATAVRLMDIRTHCVPYYGFEWRTPWRYVQTIGKFASCVIASKSEIIHLNHQFLAEYLVRVGQMTRRTTVCHIRNLLTDTEVKDLLPWLSKADAIVGVSHAVLVPLQKSGMPENKLHLVHNGIDISAYEQVQKPLPATEFGFPENSKLVGMIGRIVPEKGPEDLLLAAAQVVSHSDDTRFIIIGSDNTEGEYIQELRTSAAKLGLSNHVYFTGFRSDIPALLQVLDLVVVPSRPSMPEGLPNTVLEGLAAGKVVIATPNSGVPEILCHGVNGFLVDFDDVDSLAQTIIQALTLPEEKIGQLQINARNAVRQRTIDNQVKALGSLYRDILEHKNRCTYGG